MQSAKSNSKPSRKKLAVSKITISNLNTEELDKLYGGTKTEKSNYACDTRPLGFSCIDNPVKLV
jgi:hypothetical protein